MPNGDKDFSFIDRVLQNLARAQGLDTPLAQDVQDPAVTQALTPLVEVSPTEPQTLDELTAAFNLDAIVAEIESGLTEIVDTPNVMDSLVKGVKEGVFTPLQVFTGVPDEEIDPEHPIARTIGQLGGILVSFVPLFAGTRIALAGVGLTKALGAYPVLNRVIEGALAFGIFEAGAGTVEGIPQRFARGAAIGGAFEFAIVKMFPGKAISSRKGKSRKGQPIAPEDVNVERNIHPGGTRNPAEMSSRIINLAEPGVESDQVLMEIGQSYLPGGSVLVRNVTEPGPLISKILQKFPNIETRVRPGIEKGIFEILVRDRGASQPQLIQSLLGAGFIRVTGIKPPPPEVAPSLSRVSRLVRNLVRRGGPESVFEAPAVTFEEAVRLIELNAFGELGIPVTKNLTGEQIAHTVAIEGSVRGLATFKPNRIFISTGQTMVQRFENLIHEYMHHVTRTFARGKFDVGTERELAELLLSRPLTEAEIAAVERGGSVPLNLEEIFNIRQGRITRTFEGPATRGEMVAFDAKMTRLIDEFDAVAIEVLQRALGITKRRAALEWANDLGYYRKADEMISSMAELLFLDAGAARRIAPRASKIVGGLIQRESPKMRMLLSKQEHRNVDDWFRFVLQGDKEAQVLARTAIEEIPKLADQYAAEGGFAGMRIIANGLPTMWVRRIGANILTKNAITGQTEIVPFTRVFRPVSAIPVEASTLVKRTVRGVFNEFRERPNWVGMNLFDVENNGVRRAVLELTNYDIVRNGQEGLSRWMRENNLTRLAEREEILAKARDLGKDGLLVEDEGAYIAFVANPESLRVTEDVLYSGLLEDVSGNLGENVFLLKFNSVAEGILRQAGATERELPFFIDTARLEFGDDLFQLLDPELKSIINTLSNERLTLRIIDDVETLGGRANLKVEKVGPDRYRLREPDTGVEVFRGTEEEVSNFSARAALDDGAVDLIEGQVSSGMFRKGFGGGGPPVRFQSTEMATPPPGETGGWVRRVLDQLNLFLPFATAMENLTKSAENAGLGALFTKIYNPGQEAVARKIPLEMGATIRPELGKTWNDQIRLVQDLVQKIKPKRREFTTGWVEATSRPEIERAGGLLDRAMNTEEIQVAQFMERLGMDLEIPRLLAITEMIRNLIKNKQSFLGRADRLAADSPELASTIQELRLIAQATPDKAADIIKQLTRLSNEEKAAINILEPLLDRSSNDFSIFAVSRWLDAPVVRQGQTGRQAFAELNNMTREEIAVGEALDDLLQSAFSNSNIDANRQVKGFWPHFRRWAEQGFVLNRGLGKQLAPEPSIAWADRAYRGGELGVYVTDPVVYGYKQVMNLMIKRHLDPRLPAMKKEIDTIRAAGESRLADLMDEYVMEIRGRPHGTFERLNKALTRFADSMGIPNPNQHVESYINGIVSTAYSATIPFRAALIARNYFQMWQMTPPRIGINWFLKGFKESLTQEGFQRAVNAGAVPIDVLPLFASDVITNLRAFQTLPLRMKRIFERGFNWYRKADDFGRAVAYNGLRARIKNSLGPFMRDEITWEEFITRSKIRTFTEVDQRTFGELFSVGRVDDAIDHLGTTLARETHFRYGHAAHPAGWGSVYGRVFGQFGTWPVQYKDFLLEGAARGTTGDKIQFFGTHIAMNLGLASAGAAAGVNLWSFVSFNALQYTGGPWADVALDLVRAYGGTPAEAQLARRSLFFNFPTFSDPRSAAVTSWRMQQEHSAMLKTIFPSSF